MASHKSLLKDALLGGPNYLMDIARAFINSVLPKKKDEEPGSRIPPPPVNDRSSDVPPNRTVILSWASPMRPFVPRSKEYYRRVVSLVFVAGVLLVVAGQFLLLGVFVSVAVLFYVLSSTPPEKVKHEIDNYGIFHLGRQYYWSDFKFFFFSTEHGNIRMLNIDTVEPFPGRLTLIIEDVDEKRVGEVLSQYLPHREAPPQTIFDKAFKHISSKLSLE